MDLPVYLQIPFSILNPDPSDREPKSINPRSVQIAFLRILNELRGKKRNDQNKQETRQTS